MRVYELAKELNLKSQDLIHKLKELGYAVTNHFSELDEGAVRRIRTIFSQTKEEKPRIQENRIGSTLIRRRTTSPPKEETKPGSQEKKGEEIPPPHPPPPPPPVESERLSLQEVGEHPETKEEPQVASTPSPTGARIIARIELEPPSPPAPPPQQPSEEKEEAKKPRRVVGKRLYRPSRAEEQSLAKIMKLREKGKKEEPATQPMKAEKKKVRVGETIQVGDLARAMGVKSSDIIKKFLEMGMTVTINSILDPETAAIIASEYGYEIEQVGFQEEEWLKHYAVIENPQPRPPVVTVMGHVDHGKTTLLDTIRKTRVAQSESGGITQHIGAYEVMIGERKITFIDTPGHEAFTALRARGASVTDVVVLVVAANDGVQPQTIEAIQHARAAKVPIVVAMNKIDLPEAQPERVKQELTQYGLIPEEWGGDTLMVPISAKTGEGIDKLLEAILIQADLLDLRADPGQKGSATVIESRLDRGRGPVATVIVQNGTLRRGEYVVCGTTYGRVRLLIDSSGKEVPLATPGMPVELLGLESLPQAGEKLYVVEDERTAHKIAENRQRKAREKEMQAMARLRLDTAFQKIQEGESKELPLVIKTDVQGSMEAIEKLIQNLNQSEKEARIRIVRMGVGAITENDVNLAAASNGVVIGFNIRPDSKASMKAHEFGVEIKVYSIIYDLIEDLRRALSGMLAPEKKEVSLGWAKVLQIFPIKGVGTVAGSKVIHGKFLRGMRVRLVRNGEVLYDGSIANLRRFKNDVDEVLEGQECGILLENFNKVEAGDELECYQMIEIRRTLGAAPS
jgi:translation initiation factor IF-2